MNVKYAWRSIRAAFCPQNGFFRGVLFLCLAIVYRWYTKWCVFVYLPVYKHQIEGNRVLFDSVPFIDYAVVQLSLKCSSMSTGNFNSWALFFCANTVCPSISKEKHLTSHYMVFLVSHELVQLICVLVFQLKWCAWIAVYCSFISFANSRSSEDTKQMMSSFMWVYNTVCFCIQDMLYVCAPCALFLH